MLCYMFCLKIQGEKLFSAIRVPL